MYCKRNHLSASMCSMMVLLKEWTHRHRSLATLLPKNLIFITQHKTFSNCCPDHESKTNAFTRITGWRSNVWSIYCPKRATGNDCGDLSRSRQSVKALYTLKIGISACPMRWIWDGPMAPLDPLSFGCCCVRCHRYPLSRA